MNLRLFLYFLLYQVQYAQFYAEVFDIFSVVLCRVISIVLFEFYMQQHIWPGPLVEGVFLQCVFVTSLKKINVYSCVGLCLGLQWNSVASVVLYNTKLCLLIWLCSITWIQRWYFKQFFDSSGLFYLTYLGVCECMCMCFHIMLKIIFLRPVRNCDQPFLNVSKK